MFTESLFTENFEAFSEAYNTLYAKLNQKGGLNRKYDRAGTVANGYYLELSRGNGFLQLVVKDGGRVIRSVFTME